MGNSYVQATKVLEQSQESELKNAKEDATIVLAAIISISIAIVLSMQAMLARTYNKYLKFVKTLATFLTDYKETPRSKLIKKYIPPL